MLISWLKGVKDNTLGSLGWALVQFDSNPECAGFVRTKVLQEKVYLLPANNPRIKALPNETLKPAFEHSTLPQKFIYGGNSCCFMQQSETLCFQPNTADQYIQVFVRIYDCNIFFVLRRPFSGSKIYAVKVLAFRRRNITMRLIAKHSAVNCHIWILWGHPCAFQPTSAMVYSGNPLSFAEKSTQMQLPLKKGHFMQHLGNCAAERVRNELTTLGQVRSHEGWAVKLRRHEDMDRGTKSPF